MNFLDADLNKTDPLMSDLLMGEIHRQEEKLLLNAATSITPLSIREIQGSVFDNIDAEGYIPSYIAEQSLDELSNIDHQLDMYRIYRDDRFNKCCEYANIVEALAIKRLALAFSSENAKAENIFVNVQVPTGALANEIVYDALLEKGDLILSLGTSDGGHTTHGDPEHQSHEKYKVINYHLIMPEGAFDYDEISDILKNQKPKLLIAGASAYPLSIDWQRLRDAIDENSPQTLFMADIAHTAGLVAGGAFNNPLGIADVVTMVGYKTFCGPRAAAIMTTDKGLAERIDETVFPKVMGSPLLLGIAGLAVAAGIAMTDEYKEMQKGIVENARALSDMLLERGLNVTYGRTDSHIVLLDCTGYGSGRKMMDILEDCNILVNAVKVPSVDGYHDGLRLGTTSVTQMQITKDELATIADIIANVFESVKNDTTIDYNFIKSQVRTVMER